MQRVLVSFQAEVRSCSRSKVHDVRADCSTLIGSALSEPRSGRHRNFPVQIASQDGKARLRAANPGRRLTPQDASSPACDSAFTCEERRNAWPAPAYYFLRLSFALRKPSPHYSPPGNHIYPLSAPLPSASSALLCFITTDPTTAIMSKTFTVDEVAGHKTASDLYIIVDQDVYDLTKFQDEHPGGKKSM